MPSKDKSKPMSSRPQTAVELAPEGALAATIPQGSDTPTYAFAPLAAGALVPGVAEANIRTQDAVVDSHPQGSRTSSRRAATRSRWSCPTPRSGSLCWTSIPCLAKAAEAIPVLRFRLRKMVPFDVEHAALSYQILVQNASSVKVLATVMPGPVLAEYEAAVRAAGYEPGVVSALEPGLARRTRIARAHSGRQPQRADPHHLDYQRLGPASVPHRRSSRRP